MSDLEGLITLGLIIWAFASGGPIVGLLALIFFAIVIIGTKE